VAFKTFGERIGRRYCLGHKNHKPANRQSNYMIFQHSCFSKLDPEHTTISFGRLGLDQLQIGPLAQKAFTSSLLLSSYNFSAGKL
jgi:hypothetical protein